MKILPLSQSFSLFLSLSLSLSLFLSLVVSLTIHLFSSPRYLLHNLLNMNANLMSLEPTESANQPIAARYLDHVTGNQPITDQYSVGSWPGHTLDKQQEF